MNKRLREDRSKTMNIHNYLDKDTLIKKNEVYVDRLTTYIHKYSFALTFLFNIL